MSDRAVGIYTFYIGEEVVATGTFEEISKQTGIKDGTLRFYTTPSAAKRNRKRRMVRVGTQGRAETEDIDYDRLKELHKEFDYEPKEVAQVLGIESSGYWKKYRGERRFTYKELEEIADLFFVDVEELLK